MKDMFTDIVRKILENAAVQAQRLNSDQIDTEHLLLGMIDENIGVGLNILQSLGVDLDELRIDIENSIIDNSDTMVVGSIPFSVTVNKIINTAQIEADSMNFKHIGTEHLLLAILKQKNTNVFNILIQYGLSYEKVKKELFAAGHSKTTPNKREKHSATPYLNRYGTDLTEMAADGKLDHLIGREQEIERLLLILSRRKKNNPILIGEPGVGKTAIVEGIAQKIVLGEVPDKILNRRIVSLDMGSVVAGTKFRGQFEERIKNILKEIANSSDMIIFIDEIHTIIGAGGSEGSLDAANMLKPMLARGEIHCIGATTIEEFRKYIEKDKALERRFQPLFVDSPTVEQTFEILKGIIPEYEKFHNVKYDLPALKEAAVLSDRYINDRYLPDKAIDIVDEAGAFLSLDTQVLPPEIKDLEKALLTIEQKKQKAVHEQDYEKAASLRDNERRMRHEIDVSKEEWRKFYSQSLPVVNQNVIETVISKMTGIPLKQLSDDEKELLLQIEQKLQGELIGQNHVISKIVKALKRSRSGLRNHNRPIGSFLFLGPSGVGKTYSAELLAKLFFQREDALIRFDMTEFVEKFNSSRLIGAPPGYVGFQEGGQLTEQVRKKPYSLILFDEIEKAHPDIYNLLLQILDTGFLTDANSKRVNFTNTIIILTSNIGNAEIFHKNQLGFSNSQDLNEKQIEHSLKKQLKNYFKPELINRFDDIVVFNSLKKENLKEITSLLFKETQEKVKSHDIKLSVASNVFDAIIELNEDSEDNGARHLRRNIQKEIEDQLSEKLLEEDFKPGDQIQAKLIKNKIVLKKI